MRRKKGFTLIELIIVIAIIGILLGILIPSWGFYLQRSRTRTQNAKAKTIFNAAQTIVTDMNFSERKSYNKFMEAYSVNDTAKIEKAVKSIYGDFPKSDAGTIIGTENEWYYYWDGNTGYRVDKDGNAISTTGWFKVKSDWNTKIGNSIKKILDEDEMVYKIYVKDYKVMSVVSSRFENDRYLGAYPTNLDELEEAGKEDDADDARQKHVKGADMNSFITGAADVPEET